MVAALLIVIVFFLGLLLVATEHLHHINRAAVSMFMGIVCWMIYIAHGSAFLVDEHPIEFLSYLSSHPAQSTSVREYIADTVFMHYARFATEVVLYLLAVIYIVEVLRNNGCFDFLQEWLRTRSTRRYLWVLASFTFLVSINLDNLITTCLMLSIMHPMIADGKQRLMFGSVIVVAANLGGAFTVIGDVSSLSLWTRGLVTPTTYTALLAPSCLAAFLTIVLLVQRSLPERLSLMQTRPPYRGDDTVLSRQSRLLLFLVGIGGLWFIRTFHRITQLSPFVGALCVLALLWMVDELCNRSLLASDRMVRRREPLALQYAGHQQILYFIGLVLALGAVTETGLLRSLLQWLTPGFNTDMYVVGAGDGLLSAVVGNIATLLSGITVFTQDTASSLPQFDILYAENGTFWPLLSYSTSLGGSLLCIGTLAGHALMRMEGASLRWYVRHIAPKVLAGWLVGLGVFYLIHAVLG